MEEVTHKQIYDRLVAVEGKVNEIDQNTKGMVAAFDAAKVLLLFSTFWVSLPSLS